MLSFSTYVPCSDMCGLEGRSNFYSVYYTTGSAYIEPVIGTENVGTYDGGQDRERVLRKKSLARGMAGSPNFHPTKGDGLKAVFQASTGNLLVIEAFLPGVTKSRAIYWDLWSP
jgi:hypothetical protein